MKTNLALGMAFPVDCYNSGGVVVCRSVGRFCRRRAVLFPSPVMRGVFAIGGDILRVSALNC